MNAGLFFRRSQGTPLRRRRVSDAARPRPRRRWRLAIFATVFGLLWVFPGARHAMVERAVQRISLGQEAQFGRNAFLSLRPSLRLIDDPVTRAEIAKLSAAVQAGIPEQDRLHPLRVFVSADPTANAFALPGGYVVLNAGLLLESESPEEIAGVLAHEFAHVTRRHSTHRVIETLGLRLLYCACFGDSDSTLDELGGGLMLIAGELEFSRAHEREADAVALETLARAEIDPRGLMAFFARHDHDEDGVFSGGEIAMTFLSSHPSHPERIAMIRAAVQEERPAYRTLEVDWAAFKARLAGLPELAGSELELERAPAPEAGGK
ncbi:MAG: M48 family metallopeptidase [Planctomycetes bacterium]|nr:M48 family metallopeptidase [Planctomycetota bacterium]